MGPLDHPGAAFISLPFAATGQTKAYYVDSEPGARDRQNVRDGHYFAWGYEHLLYSAVTTDAGASQPNAAAAKLIGLITGATHDPTFDYVQLDAVAGTIPLCAMSVQKTNDSPGYLAPYAPADTCQCAYVAAASGRARQLHPLHGRRRRHLLRKRQELPPRLLRVKGLDHA